MFVFFPAFWVYHSNNTNKELAWYVKNKERNTKIQIFQLWMKPY